MRPAWLAAAAILIGGLLFLAPRAMRRPARAQPAAETAAPVVQVARVEVRDVERSIRLTGRFESLDEAQVASTQGGRIVELTVVEGDVVQSGQLLARLDDPQGEGRQREAEAATRGAQAQVERAKTARSLREAELERRINLAKEGVRAAEIQVETAESARRLTLQTTAAEVERARAGVQSARSALEKAKAGARPQERRLAELGVVQARKAAETARKELADLETLHAKGGVPRVQVVRAREVLDRADAAVTDALTRLELLQQGPTREELAELQAQVRGAEAAEKAAEAAAGKADIQAREVAAAQSSLQRARLELSAAEASRRELELIEHDSDAARAGRDQAAAGASLVAGSRREARVTAPFAGRVATVHLHPGDVAGPGRPIVTLVGEQRLYLKVAVPARQISELRPGQPCWVTSEALSAGRLRGKVSSVSPIAAPDGRSFPVRIEVSDSSRLFPGAFARAQVVVERFPQAYVVPVEALQGSGEQIWVVRAGRVAEIAVRVLVHNGATVALSGELSAQDQVIVARGPLVEPGDVVNSR